MFVPSKKLSHSFSDLFLNAGLLLNTNLLFFPFFESRPFITLLSQKNLCVIPGATRPYFPCRFF